MNNMKKNINIGDFLIPDNENDPVVLFIFNEYESDIDDVVYINNGSVFEIHYPSGNILCIDVQNESVFNRIKLVEKILIIEVEDTDGNVSALYEVIKKPA